MLKNSVGEFYWWINHLSLWQHIQRKIMEPQEVRPSMNCSLSSTLMYSVDNLWTLRNLALRGIPPQGEIPGHSLLWSWRAQRDSLLRTNIYRTERWLDLVHTFPPWPEFRLGNSCVDQQPYGSSTFQIAQFWYTGVSAALLNYFNSLHL